MPFAAVNGIDVYFELHGAGAPLLLLRARAGHDVVADLASIGHPTLVCNGGAS